MVKIVGVLDSLCVCLKTGSETGKEFAAGATRSLAMVKSNVEVLDNAGVIPLLIDIMHQGNEKAKKSAVGGLYNMCVVDKVKDKIKALGVKAGEIGWSGNW